MRGQWGSYGAVTSSGLITKEGIWPSGPSPKVPSYTTT